MLASTVKFSTHQRNPPPDTNRCPDRGPHRETRPHVSEPSGPNSVLRPSPTNPGFPLPPRRRTDTTSCTH
jgi:hypothetical protein